MPVYFVVRAEPNTPPAAAFDAIAVGVIYSAPLELIFYNDLDTYLNGSECAPPTSRECTSTTGGQRSITGKVIFLLMVGAMMMQPLKTVKGVSAVAGGQLLKTVLSLSGEQPFDDPLGIINDENGVLLDGASAEMISPWDPEMICLARRKASSSGS